MTAESLAVALRPYRSKSDGGYMACCPAHDDNDPSLAIDEKDGRILVHCKAGCSQDEVIGGLRGRGLLLNGCDPLPPTPKPSTRKSFTAVTPVPFDAPPPPSEHSRLGKPSMTHGYHNEDGELLQHVYRFDPSTGKQVLPLIYCTDGNLSEWRYQALAVPRPLYGLERLKSSDHVLIVEGEKTADAARRMLGFDIPVVTWSGGSNAVAKANWVPLAGKSVVLWPDNDSPGFKAAIAVADELAKVDAASIKIVEPPSGVPEKWDLANAEEEGWAGEQVRERLKTSLTVDDFKAKHFAPSTEDTSSCNEPDVESADEWPKPTPLPDQLHPVAEFDFDLLPITLKQWVMDICERIQCPPDFVAVGVMSGLGALIGRKIGIRPQTRTDWTVTANQWGLIVGRPGVLKSPALEQALAPLKRLVAQANKAYTADLDYFELQAQAAGLRSDAAKKKATVMLKNDPDADLLSVLSVPTVDKPTLKRYMANDTSPAALGELLRQNHNGLLVYRDELVSLLRGLDREDQAEGRGFYLTGWNGDSGYTFDRIGRGMNLHIPAVCISILGGTQPGRLSDYINHAIKGGAADDGLIQRFGLLVWPDVVGPWEDVDRWPDSEAKREANRVFDSLATIDPAAVGAQQDTDHNGDPEGLPYLRFDGGGLEMFLEWRTDLEGRLRDGELHPAIESHLAKYRKLVPGLALILHLAEGRTGPVSEQATLQALGWAEYLETHANRAYGSVTQVEVGAAKAILKHLRKGDLPLEFSARDVYRKGWSHLSAKEQVTDALSLLVDYDWLREEQVTTGGRTSTVYHANPKGLS